jgi:hypothetical protein
VAFAPYSDTANLLDVPVAQALIKAPPTGGAPVRPLGLRCGHGAPGRSGRAQARVWCPVGRSAATNEAPLASQIAAAATGLLEAHRARWNLDNAAHGRTSNRARGTDVTLPSARRAVSHGRGPLMRPQGLRCCPGPKGGRDDTIIGVDLDRSREQCRGDLNDTFAGA